MRRSHGPSGAVLHAARLLLLAALLAPPPTSAQQFLDFANAGGPPFVEGPVFELDEETLSQVLLNGVVANGRYTLTTAGPSGSYTLTGRYLSWQCGPEPGSYLAAVEATLTNPDGTSTTSLTCELGVVDTSDVAIGGTNRLTTSEGACPTSSAEGLLLRYFPNYPAVPNQCGEPVFAAAPIPAPAPAPAPVELVAGAPAAAPELLDSADPISEPAAGAEALLTPALGLNTSSDQAAAASSTDSSQSASGAEGSGSNSSAGSQPGGGGGGSGGGGGKTGGKDGKERGKGGGKEKGAGKAKGKGKKPGKGGKKPKGAGKKDKGKKGPQKRRKLLAW